MGVGDGEREAHLTRAIPRDGYADSHNSTSPEAGAPGGVELEVRARGVGLEVGSHKARRPPWGSRGGLERTWMRVVS